MQWKNTMPKKKMNDENEKRRNLSWKSTKDDLGLQGGYLDWKPAKGGSSKED